MTKNSCLKRGMLGIDSVPANEALLISPDNNEVSTMSDFDRNYASPFGRVAGRTDAAAVDAGLRAYMLRIYNYMTIGLAITGFAALGVYMAAVTSDPTGAVARIGNAYLTS